MSQATISCIIPPPGLQEATKNSTFVWQENLKELFRNAKDRFPDVVWEVGGGGGVDENDTMKEMDVDVDEVWGHKAIVYARAPPSFQTRYFSFRQPLAPLPPGDADYPDESESLKPRTRTPSPVPSTTTTGTATIIQPQPIPTTAPSLLRLTSSINSTLFSNELEYLYTGKGFGEAFEFLFDSSESSRLRGVDDDDDENDNCDHPDPEALRIDKLRKDLVFMWRSRLYSDVRIALTGNFSSTVTNESTTAIFSSHRFILVSRSPYFHDELLSWPAKSEPPTLNLPSPPFTPASLHFTLGFMYTGTLIFSHRSYDLSTSFAILRASMYLQLSSLHDEIQARIVQEMLHGLFHAFIPFEEYERLTNGKWGTGGCRCRQCARRVPRVLEFAMAEDVKNLHLERGCRRALVGLFGEGWVHQEFSSLPLKIRESIQKGLSKRTTPLNVFPLLFAAEHGLGKLGVVIEPWGDVSKEMILSARRTIDEVLCRESEACFNSEDWMELMEATGVRFEDGERVAWAMAAVLRGVKEASAASLYQTLVSSILLRPHPTDLNAPLLPATSHVHVQVEETRLELLKWIGKRWLGIRQERGFDVLEGWALKEISDHIEVPTQDLLNPLPQTPNSKSPKRPPTAPNSLLRPTSNHPHTSKVDAESDMASSMLVSVLSRSLPARQTSTAPSFVGSSASSVRSAVRSASESYASAMTGNTVGRSNGGMSPAKMIVSETRASGRTVELKDRPDSKLTPSVVSFRRTPSPSILESDVLEEEEGTEDGEEEEEHAIDPQPVKKVLITRASLASVTSRSTLSSLTGTSASASVRPISSASSVRPHTTVRRSLASNRTPTKSPASRTNRISTTSTASRLTSSLSVAESTTTYRTAVTGLRSSPTNRSRRTSGASTISARTASGGTGDKRNSPVSERTRRISNASVSSVASSVRVRTTSAGAKPVGGANSPVNERTRRISGASVSSVASSIKSTRDRTISNGKKPAGGATLSVPVMDPTKLSPPGVSRPGSIHSSISGGSTSTSNSRKVIRKVALVKKNGDVDRSSRSSEAPVKESEVEELKEKVIEEEMDVGDEQEAVKEDDAVTEDIVIEDRPLSDASSTMSVDPPSTHSIPTTSEHKKTSSSTSTASVSTLKRKGSSDTIKTVKSSPPISADAPLTKELPPTPSSQPAPLPQQHRQPPLQHQSANLKPEPLSTSAVVVVPQGATLEIGIPCIIASKRKRFKAFARYIGEVEGETGAWVGVEVPMPFGDSWTSSEGVEKVNGDDRQWNDGSWGGIRYFQIGGMGGSEWDYGGGGTNEDRASRRRVDGGTSVFGGGGSTIWGNGGRGGKGILKREGDQFSIASASEMRRKKVRSVSPAVSDMSGVETRGLFVRPQQVLYVVDAVGADL